MSFVLHGHTTVTLSRSDPNVDAGACVLKMEAPDLGWMSKALDASDARELATALLYFANEAPRRSMVDDAIARVERIAGPSS